MEFPRSDAGSRNRKTKEQKLTDNLETYCYIRHGSPTVLFYERNRTQDHEYVYECRVPHPFSEAGCLGFSFCERVGFDTTVLLPFQAHETRIRTRLAPRHFIPTS